MGNEAKRKSTEDRAAAGRDRREIRGYCIWGTRYASRVGAWSHI